MGRRALRKVDPELDLSHYLKTIEYLTPWAPEIWFGNAHPVEVEVGSGKGLFMATASADSPDTNFLGIEIAKKFARFCAARLAKRQLRNGIMMAGDAQPLFNDVMPSESVAAVHIYFPDPWWKKRHHKRRIMNQPFLLQVHRVLANDGKLHFWTDVKEYFDEALDLIRRELPFQGPEQVAEKPSEHDLDYRTHFERRMRMHEKPIYRSLFSK